MITDAYMRETLKTMKPYTIVLLHRTPKRKEPGADDIVWEHGRRNFHLRRDGLLSIVCQVDKDESDIAGVCIFSTSLEKTRQIMNGDPAVRAGIFICEIHKIEGFPGDALKS